MSEVVLRDEAAAPAAAGDGLTAGAMLRQAREAAGLHVAAMAVALKVPVGKIEALEQDRYDLLPDAVFARALASTVCRTLKVDPQPVLDRLPQTTAPRLLQDTDGLNAPFRSPRDAAAATWRDQLTRPVSLAVGALLLGALVVVLWPNSQSDDGAVVAKTNAPAESAPSAAAATLAPAGEHAGSDVAPAAAAQLQPVSGAVPAPASAPIPVATRSAEPAAPAPATASEPPAATAVAPVAAAAAATVVFRARAQSWIEVRDAKGAVPVRKVLAAGESANVSGPLPLQVVVGNVKGTEVDVRGQRFDLQHLARDNVARFQIK